MVANAGILGALTPMSHVEPKTFDDVMAINVTANYRLIRSLDPLLQKSDAGRAVFLTSGAAWAPIAYWGPYSVSKAAAELMARIYAAETATTNLRVNVFNPGPIRTRMRASAMPGEDPMTLDTPENCAEKIIDLCVPSYTGNGTTSAIAASSTSSPRSPEAGIGAGGVAGLGSSRAGIVVARVRAAIRWCFLEALRLGLPTATGPRLALSSRAATASAIAVSVTCSPRPARSWRAWFQASSPKGTGTRCRCFQKMVIQPPSQWLRTQIRLTS